MSTRTVTFAEYAEQITRLNRNSMEMLLNLGRVLTSEDEEVEFSVALPNSESVTFTARTIAQLSRIVDKLVADLEAIQGLNDSGSAVIRMADGSTAELQVNYNQEAPDIVSVPSVTTFSVDSNRMLQTLTAPTTFVTLDFSDSMPSSYSPSRVTARTYLVRFEQDSLGNYTSRGENARQDFIQNYVGRNDVSQEELLQFLRTKVGVVRERWSYDQTLTVRPPRPLYNGVFSVRGTNFDDRANRLYYTIDKREYLNNQTQRQQQLAVGDILQPNTLLSTAKWVIREVRTRNGQPEVYLEPKAGFGSVPQGDDVLQIESPTFGGNTVDVNINFDSYYCVFLKAVDPKTGTESRNWSEGVAFWSNGTTLQSNDDSNGANFGDYFLDRMVDLGLLFGDMGRREIPAQFGVIPNTPTLSAEQFTTSTVNSHLVNNANLESQVQRLRSQSRSIEKSIQSNRNALRLKRSRLSNGQFKSDEKARLQADIAELTDTVNSQQEERQSIVDELQQLLSQQEQQVQAKYQAVAFVAVPEPVSHPQTGTQQVVQFEWEVQKLSKTNNAQDQTVTERVDANGNRVVSVQSQWDRYQGIMRQRTFDPVSRTYRWEQESESDVQQQNFNRISFQMEPNEKARVRVRVKSEVQYSTAPLYSDWSEIVEYEFPEDLERQFDSLETVRNQTLVDQARVAVDSDLNRRQVFPHVDEQIEDDGRIFRHPGSSITSGFRDAQNRQLSVTEYFTVMQNELNELRALVTQSVGQLQISLERAGQSLVIRPNQSALEVDLIAENYASFTNGQTDNNVKVIDDMVMVLQNLSTEAPVNIVSGRGFSLAEDSPFFNSANSDEGQAAWANFNDRYVTTGDGRLQTDFQWIWLKNNVDSWDTDTSALVSSNVNLTVPRTDTSPVPIVENGAWSSNNQSGFGVTVLPIVSDQAFLVDDGFRKRFSIAAGQRVEIPIKVYFKFDVSSAVSTVSKADVLQQAGTSVVTRSKSLSFYMEQENQNQPLNWDLLFRVTNFNPNNATESDFDIVTV